jgi:hypothetical protein
MKLAYVGLLAVGCCIGGYFLGKGSNAGVVHDNERFSISIQDSLVELKAHHLEKNYVLTTLNNEVYLGDAQHNFNGATALTFEEARKYVTSAYSSIEKKIYE